MWNIFKRKQATGAFLEPEDYRNVPLATITKILQRPPDNYLNENINLAEVYNQRRLGICVSTAQTLQLELLYDNEVDFSVRFGYRMAKWLDGPKWKNIEGTWGTSVAKVHKDFGSATVKTRPENFFLSHFNYINFIFTPEEIKEARKYRLKGYVFANTVNEIKTGVIEHQSVSVTVKAKAMWDNTQGYHRVLIVGWNKKGFLIRNSWGSGKLELMPYDITRLRNIIYVKKEDEKKKIKDYIKKQEAKFKYFSPKEIVGLKIELVEKLDKMRGFCGFPFVITSGFRTAEENRKVGGVSNSKHLTGSAVDIRARTGAERDKILEASFKYNIGGKGVGDNFIHLDIGERRAWNYK